MTVKDLIKYLEKLEQDREIIVIAKDPTDYEYPTVVTTDIICLEEVYGDVAEMAGFEEVEPDPETGEIIEHQCYVIRVDA